jgi:zinc-ribbon domain
LGWIAIAIGALLFLLSLLSVLGVTSSDQLAQAQSALVVVLAFAAAIFIVVFGLSLVIFGELIQVFLDIEENTRDSVTKLRALQTEIAGNTSARLPHDAQPAPPTCSSCGAKNEIGSKFCEQCGRAL